MTAEETLTRPQVARRAAIGLGGLFTVAGLAVSPSVAVAENATPAQTGGRLAGGTTSFLNVRTMFGARGDGKTDDTAAIQTALNRASNGQPYTIYLPRGTYRLTRELVVPFSPGLRIVGEGSEGPSTRLLQTTAGQAILRFSRSLTHTVYMADFELAYPSPQTARGSMAVVYRDETDKAPSWYHHVYERLKVINAYRGFSLDDSAGSRATVWHCMWRDVNFFQIKHSCVRLVMNKPNGQPVLAFQNIGVFNTNGPKVRSTGAALEFGPAEVMVDQYDIEGWATPVFSMTAGTFATLRGVHVEQHIFAQPTSVLFNFDNTTFTLDGFSLQGWNTKTNRNQLILFQVQSGAAGRISNGTVEVFTDQATPYLRETLWRPGSDSDRTVAVEYVTRRGGGVYLPGTGPRAKETTKALSLAGNLSNGRRGISVPSDGAVYMYSPDGKRHALTVGNDGRLQVSPAT